MSLAPALLSRLRAGRPLLLGSDPAATLRAQGRPLSGMAALGRLLRDEPSAVAALHAGDIAAGADVLLALTSDTMTIALGHIGMAFRAAALTRCAIDLAVDAAKRAPRPVSVGGVIGNPWVTVPAIERAEEECSLHAARLVADGCELIVARGLAAAEGAPPGLLRASRRLAVTSAAATGLPTWALIELAEGDQAASGDPIEALVAEVMEAGAQLVLLEAPSVDVGLAALRRVEAARAGAPAGVLLAAQAEGPDAARAWAEDGKALADAGARVLGGGAFVTADHVAALASALSGGSRQPGSPEPGPHA